MCYMRRVSPRDVPNHSGETPPEAEAGAAVIITNRGRPVAVLSPYPAGRTPLEILRALGRTRPPQAPRDALRDIEPIRIDVSSKQLIRESRRDY